MKALTKNSNKNGTPNTALQQKGSDAFFGVQAKLTIGSADDAYEREADTMAESIVGNSTKQNNYFGGNSFFPGVSGSTVQKSNSEEEQVQEKPLAASVTPLVQMASEEEQPIQEKCAECEGEEQNIQNKTSDTHIQRKLSVEDDYPTKYVKDMQSHVKIEGEDPSKKLTKKDRLSLVKKQLGKISPEFKMDGSGKVKQENLKTEDKLAKGSKATGSCCLHVLSRPTSKTDWKIVVADHLSPHTLEKKHTVLINSNLNPVTYGFHNKKGKQISYGPNPELILGHELCGHASLMELGSHAKGKRAVSDVHDSTINIENEIAKSLGKKEDQLRGSASDGPHKGESFGHGEVINFGFNKYDVSKLDPKEQDKLKFISDIVKTFDFFVELRGHSDNVGSEGAKQSVSDKRAKNVFLFLRKLGVPLRASVDVGEKNDIQVNRFLLKGMSDKEPLKGFDPLSEQHKLRRVDVFISSFPAGISELPKGISKSKRKKLSNPGKVKEPDKVKEILGAGTPCEKLLVTKAYRS